MRSDRSDMTAALRKRRLAAMGSCALFGLTILAAPAQSRPPQRIGACDQTTIKLIGTRFGDKLVKPQSGGIDEGTTVVLANGVFGVSYQFVPAVAASKVGDRVLTCLISVPQDCPKGDTRGKVYTTTNMRTQDSWTLPDAQHMCGGA